MEVDGVRLTRDEVLDVLWLFVIAAAKDLDVGGCTTRAGERNGRTLRQDGG